MLSDELKSEIQGHYSRLLESRQLKPRLGQKQMIAEIARVLAAVETDSEGKRTSSEPAVGVIEAGTGTGKTIAYLVPALPLARALGKKVVLATATVALQEQVMYKDLPDLLRHGDMDFSFSLAKGRGRYLCLSRLDNLLRDDNSSREALADLFGVALEDPGHEDRALYQRMLDALSDGQWKGDRDDWPEALEDAQWRNVAVEHGQCSGSRCSYFSNCCFFRGREQMEKADCVVANHDLVLADLSLGGGVILPPPEEAIYIFDEAHHLPAKGISHFSHTLRLRAGIAWLEQLGGVFARLQSQGVGGGNLYSLLDEAAALARELRGDLGEASLVFAQLEAAAAAAGPRGDTRQYVFEGGVVDPELRELCRGLQSRFGELGRVADKVLDLVKQCMEAEGGELDRQQAEAWFPAVGSICKRLEAAQELFLHFGREDAAGAPPFARWISFTDGAGTARGSAGEAEIILSCSPVVAAEALADTLWRDAFAVLMTSATLCALGNFDFLKMRAGLPDGSRFTRIGSPFDYTSAVQLQIPAKGFDPSDSESHTRAIVDLLPRLIEPRAGALVLFSSRRQMQDVLYSLDPDLKERVLCQDDHTKQRLLALHRERIDAGQGSVIFGLAGLTEGIDLPGDYCTHVVIAKIPFAVPNDPVEATLAHWVEARGGNAFQEISIPEAAMRLVQACGRLVRTEQDRGTITILDQRLLTRRYGQVILNSLPPYRRITL